ncbi:MAG: hypothetical protein A4E30_00327 [Methanomassiliicoccales archaeon PtaB.Bin215]|nr:MAG: hypothetical protein A4E30_00327 [Methanomassiliicoccales archaeon PtaB.Bin215]
MSFGEEYQGMTDREILIEVASRLSNVEGKVDDLTEQVEQIQCPSPRCQDHNERISRLEDHERIVLGAIGLGFVGSGVLVWFLTKLFGD